MKENSRTHLLPCQIHETKGPNDGFDNSREGSGASRDGAGERAGERGGSVGEFLTRFQPRAQGNRTSLF